MAVWLLFVPAFYLKHYRLIKVTMGSLVFLAFVFALRIESVTVDEIPFP